MTRGRRERLAYWRSVPLRQLGVLLAAVFCLFASLGLMKSLAAGRNSLIASFIWAAFSGVMASLYIVAVRRNPKVIPLLIVFQLAADVGVGRGIAALTAAGRLPVSPAETTLQVIPITAITLSTAAYVLFLAFIQRQGRQAIRVRMELSLAHGIQQTLVPVVNVESGNCAIYGISAPSDKVGGDLVDCVWLADGSVMAYLVDVAGHGLQAGILMGMIKTAVRTRLLDQASPAGLFERLNQVLPQVKEAHMYATCAALRIFPRSADGSTAVEFSVAGHPAILHMREDGGAATLSDEQFPIGLFLKACYRTQSVVAFPGDLFLVTSDGILEAAEKGGSEFGMERLTAICAGHRALSLPALCAEALRAVRDFGAQRDDQTLLAVRIA